MALWKCTKCSYSKETRCRPKSCPQCEGKEFEKAEE